MLIQAGVPLIAALVSWIVFRESISLLTWLAITAVIGGVAIMVSDSVSGAASPIGDALAVLIAFVFALATVITRRYAHVRMTPAACFGTIVAGAVAAIMSSGLAVSASELGVLVTFGALNFGLGLALFVTGARLIPSALAALLGTAETVLAPVWVAAIHGEIPSVEHHPWRNGGARRPSYLSQCRNVAAAARTPVETELGCDRLAKVASFLDLTAQNREVLSRPRTGPP